jgi:hypothetical protein
LDEDGHRPSEELEQAAFATFNVLPTELEILAPDAVVFFIGPKYELRLNRMFPGIKYEHLRNWKSELLYRCTHPGLPANSFWTYHPKWLRLTRNWNVVEKLGHLMGSHS